MKKFQLSAINCPSIEIECGGVVMSTNKIKNAKKNPNFDKPSLFFDVVRLAVTYSYRVLCLQRHSYIMNIVNYGVKYLML